MILYKEPSTRSSFYYDFIYLLLLFFNIFVQEMEFICYNKYVTTLYTCHQCWCFPRDKLTNTSPKFILYLKMQILLRHLLQYFLKLKTQKINARKVSGIRQKNYKLKNFIRQEWQRKRCQDAWEGRTIQ